MISVAMTTYNGEKYIEQQLMSILNQSLKPDEIVICDDCSKDDTVQKIERLCKEYNEVNIRLYKNKENLGYIRNFYKAIGLAKGDIIFLSDQDDIWHYDKLEKMSRIISETGACIICTNYRLINQDGEVIDNRSDYKINGFIRKAKLGLNKISFNRLIFGNVAQGCTYCFTKDVKDTFIKVNNQELIHDHQLMFISSLLGDAFFYNEQLIDYRIHQNNAVGIRKKDSSVGFELKKPARKPFMVSFLEDLNNVVRVPNRKLYDFLYYCRIPYFISKIGKI